jgi:hypothetical protein
MTSERSSAQSDSNLGGGTEAEIKRTVAHWGSALALTIPSPEPEADPLLLKSKLQLEENDATWFPL